MLLIYFHLDLLDALAAGASLHGKELEIDITKSVLQLAGRDPLVFKDSVKVLNEESKSKLEKIIKEASNSSLNLRREDDEHNDISIHPDISSAPHAPKIQLRSFF